MKNKVWHKVEVGLEYQNLDIYPNDTYDGIIFEIKEADNSSKMRLYLNENEMEFLILKMREMMSYVKSK